MSTDWSEADRTRQRKVWWTSLYIRKYRNGWKTKREGMKRTNV